MWFPLVLLFTLFATLQGSGNERLKDSPADELVRIKMETADNDRMKMEFSSHGRSHKFDLKEKAQRLDDVQLEIIGMDEETQQKARESLKKTRLMTDDRYGAHIAVKVDPDGAVAPTVQSGIFNLGGQQFTISSKSDSISQVSKKLVEDGNHTAEAVEAPVDGSRSTNVTYNTTLVNGTVELLVIVDYSFWSHLTEMSYASDPITDVLLYVAYMVSMVDSSYANMNNDDLKIRVSLAGVVIHASSRASQNLVENYKVKFEGKYYIEGSKVLSSFRSWLRYSSMLPPNDHAMLLTYYDVKSSLDTSIRGYAYKKAICYPGYSSSLVEVRSTITANALNAARLLAYSLGAIDDGEYGTTTYSCRNRNFIMSRYVQYTYGDDSLEKFRFSCCTQRSFHSFLSNSYTGCLNDLAAEPNYYANIDQQVQTVLPGQKYDSDDQCYMAYGTSTCYYNGDICTNLRCRHPLATSYYTCLDTNFGAADGTWCGYGKWCIQGNCVTSNTISPNQTQFCSALGCYGNEGRCKNGVNVREPEYMQCYSDDSRCDGDSDCSDGTDERNCLRVCPSYKFQCHNYTVGVKCIYMSQVCDNYRNCVDGSDEENCGYNSTTSPPTTPSPPSCGDGYHYGLSGEITSPGYPNNYPNHAECYWYVSASLSRNLQFEFIGDACIENDEISCSFDSLEIEPHGKLCGNFDSGTTIQIEKQYTYVRFRSDGDINFPGWKLKWSVICASTDYYSSFYACGYYTTCSDISKEECSSCYDVRYYCCNTCLTLNDTSNYTSTTFSPYNNTTTASLTSTSTVIDSTTTTATLSTSTTAKLCEDDPDSTRKCRVIKRRCRGSLTDAEEADCKKSCRKARVECCATCCSLFNRFC